MRSRSSHPLPPLLEIPSIPECSHLDTQCRLSCEALAAGEVQVIDSSIADAGDSISLHFQSNQEEVQWLLPFAVELVRRRLATSLPVGDLSTEQFLDGDMRSFSAAHIFVTTPSRIRLVYERIVDSDVPSLFGVSADAARRWSGLMPELASRLEQPQGRIGAPVAYADVYLSLAWILNHQLETAQWLAGRRQVGVDHVSLHIDPHEASNMIEFLTSVVGLVHIDRPPNVAVPGAWLVSSSCMLHLNWRTLEDTSGGRDSMFAGSAPNHVCIAVSSLTKIVDRLRTRGLPYKYSGSLGDYAQVWVRPYGNIVFEFQQV